MAGVRSLLFGDHYWCPDIVADGDINDALEHCDEVPLARLSAEVYSNRTAENWVDECPSS